MKIINRDAIDFNTDLNPQTGIRVESTMTSSGTIKAIKILGSAGINHVVEIFPFKIDSRQSATNLILFTNIEKEIFTFDEKGIPPLIVDIPFEKGDIIGHTALNLSLDNTHFYRIIYEVIYLED